MAGLRFTEQQARPIEFLDFTSLTLDEFLSWKRDLGKGGLAGLHRTRIQDDRPRRPEPRIRMGQRYV